MPLGIIDAKHDGALPGTELLIGDRRENAVVGAEAHLLKRVVVKVPQAPSAALIASLTPNQGEEVILVPQPNDADPNDPVVSSIQPVTQSQHQHR